MKTISYLIGCKCCNATGQIRDDTEPKGTSAPSIKQCPVCNGSCTVRATETIYENHESPNYEFRLDNNLNKQP